MAKLSEEEVFALERVSESWLHRSLTVPAANAHGPLRVTYAVAGRDDKDAPTILFHAGMFGGRWMALNWDYLAKRTGVRVICIDR